MASLRSNARSADPDPHQNVTDPEHRLLGCTVNGLGSGTVRYPNANIVAAGTKEGPEIKILSKIEKN
jgi:hypothetical protein